MSAERALCTAIPSTTRTLELSCRRIAVKGDQLESAPTDRPSRTSQVHRLSGCYSIPGLPPPADQQLMRDHLSYIIRNSSTTLILHTMRFHFEKTLSEYTDCCFFGKQSSELSGFKRSNGTGRKITASSMVVLNMLPV